MLCRAGTRCAARAPGGVELLQAVDEDVEEDVADARAAGQLGDGQVLAAAVQHLAVAHCVAVQQLQQQRAPARAHKGSGGVSVFVGCSRIILSVSAGRLGDGQVLGAAVQHLAVAHRVAVQQLQQQRAPACARRVFQGLGPTFSGRVRVQQLQQQRVPARARRVAPEGFQGQIHKSGGVTSVRQSPCSASTDSVRQNPAPCCPGQRAQGQSFSAVQWPAHSRTGPHISRRYNYTCVVQTCLCMPPWSQC